MTLLLATTSFAEPAPLQRERAAVAATPKDHPARLALLRALIAEAKKLPEGAARKPLIAEARATLSARADTVTPVEKGQYGRLSLEISRLEVRPVSLRESVLAKSFGSPSKLSAVLSRSDLYAMGTGLLDSSQGIGISPAAGGLGMLGTRDGPYEAHPPPPPDGPRTRLTIERVDIAGTMQPAVSKVVQELAPQLRACYEVAVRKRAAATGTIEWRGTLAAAGLLLNGAMAGTLNDPGAATCLAQILERAAFPVGQVDHALVVTVRGEVER